MPTQAVPASGYTTAKGLIYRDGFEIQLRGINHFGFNAKILRPQFLWAMGWKQQLAQIKSLGFNAIRCPFVPDTLYKSKGEDSSLLQPANSDIVGKSPLLILDMWMAECDRLGLYVLLDFHSVTPQWAYPLWYCNEPALIYNNKIYTKDNWISDLVFVANRYKHLAYFMGIDLFNEPHDDARWNGGDLNMQNPANYWKPAAEQAAAAVLKANPKLLIFVQGCVPMDGKSKSIPANWGEDFQAQAYMPFKISADKLVLSPHTYGPDVFGKESFKDPSFPANLTALWDVSFGQFAKAFAVVPGEWGGRYGVGVSVATGASGPADVAWQNAFVDYMLARGIRSSFYWCYTPNSGDTGGILDDQLQVREDKMKLLRRLWVPTPPIPIPPTVITITEGTVQIRGSFTITTPEK